MKFKRFYKNISLSASSFPRFHPQRSLSSHFFSPRLRYFAPEPLLPFLLSPFLPYKPSACIVALSKNHFDDDDNDDDDGDGDGNDGGSSDKSGRKNGRSSLGPGMDFPCIFRINSPREREDALALARFREENRGQKRADRRERMYLQRGKISPLRYTALILPSNPVKHTGEIKWSCAGVMYDLGTI